MAPNTELHITRITATPVVVPCRPGTVQSLDIPDDDWSRSPDANAVKVDTRNVFNLPKYVLQAQTNNGLIGIGETYREVSVEALKTSAAALLNVDLATTSLPHLPLPMNREYDAFELLAYDLRGKQLAVPVSTLLGGCVRRAVACSYWSGRRTTDDAVLVAQQAVALGFQSLKFKCNGEDPVGDWCRAIDERCPGLELVLDANQRWGDYGQAKAIIDNVTTKNVLAFEDPMSRHCLADYQALRQEIGVPLARHVALPYCDHGQRAEDALAALKADAVDGFNFNGGMAAFCRLADLANFAHLPCWHGSEIDLGILEAGYLHAAAAAPACTWPSDVLGRSIREHDLLTEPLEFINGSTTVPTGPGLGVDIDHDALERYRVGADIVLAST